jgi:hypothetical protein
MSARRESLQRTASIIALAALWLAPSASASIFQGEALDTAADYLAWFILIVMPPAGIALFWIVHVLPQKAAEKRHHPQKEAIHVLCLLSLFFGGLLWPIAWLWAYTRPPLARGTEFHEDYYVEQAEKAEQGELAIERVASLRQELDGLESRGVLNAELRLVRDRLLRVEQSTAVAPVTGAV